MRAPLALSQLPVESLKKIEAVFFDIDDTFSGGVEPELKEKKKPIHTARIVPEAYASLWLLKALKIKAIPVTGRPAGWCDHIARMWPVHAIVGENGAFYMQVTEGEREGEPAEFHKEYLESLELRKSNAEKLKALKKQILRKFKNVKLASDQKYREFDLAIDFCEDVPRWSEKKIADLLELARVSGATAKVSSIHVNIWFGSYDKWSCAKKVMRESLALEPKTDLQKILYLGDSPNDEPFFSRIENSVGVANVERFLKKMTYPPKYITQYPSGHGFAECVRRIAAAKGLQL